MDFMTGLKRTDYCGTLRLSDAGKKVTVAGWVQRRRDLGSLIFIDLRDRTGIVQLAFGEETEICAYGAGYRKGTLLKEYGYTHGRN